jgi:heat shock protein beta
MQQLVADSNQDKLKDLAALLYDAAALNSGFAVDDSKEFANRVYRVLATSLEVPADAQVEEEAEEEEEEEAEEEQQDEDEAQQVDEEPEAAKAAPTHDEL